ncbi:hypothetical protein BB559_005386 [Furculomyces boomerangus]|uniref:Oxidoreductase n=2 Tax=Harpellales TaxID=61421 RepID=A0A2T9Y8Z9_9FUNG|nr:hypothetical protein BB559_006452 [Furculomyces boomerangus]PVU88811.1 hypothetical protein BB559_005386 [Furculomyces boomerangus]PWA00724.1 hypothetical protein BB558_003201 [Smittium angustum]
MFKRIIGKTTLITGASAGIGESTARIFAEYGSNLVLTARRVERLVKLKQDILGLNPEIKVHLIGMDVSNESSVIEGFKTLPEWIPNGKIDVLINNAAVGLGTDTVLELKTNDMTKMIDTNIKGLVWVTQQVLPAMLKENNGTIINIGSLSAHMARASSGMYAATKFAMRAITDSLKAETNSTRIRVIEIDPGMVKTEFSIIRVRGDMELAENHFESIPHLSVNEVAETILFAASRSEDCVLSEITIVPNGQINAHILGTTRKDE